MEKLDRLGWAAGISFSAFGLRIGVRVSTGDLLEPVASHLPIGWKPETSSTVERLYSVVGGGKNPRSSIKRFSFLYGDVQQLARTTRLQDLCEALESDLDFYVARTSRQRLFVHAGVVAWKGRAIVIPGRSQSGKTTLVKALLEAGGVTTPTNTQFSMAAAGCILFLVRSPSEEARIRWEPGLAPKVLVLRRAPCRFQLDSLP